VLLDSRLDQWDICRAGAVLQIRRGGVENLRHPDFVGQLIGSSILSTRVRSKSMVLRRGFVGDKNLIILESW